MPNPIDEQIELIVDRTVAEMKEQTDRIIAKVGFFSFITGFVTAYCLFK